MRHYNRRLNENLDKTALINDCDKILRNTVKQIITKLQPKYKYDKELVIDYYEQGWNEQRELYHEVDKLAYKLADFIEFIKTEYDELS